MKHAIEQYIINFLEKPHSAFSGLPPCPFAKKERLSQRIHYHQSALQSSTPSPSTISRIAQFAQEDPSKTLIIFDDQIRCSIEELYQQAQHIIDGEWEAKILAVPVHPQDCFSLNGVETRSPSPTTMLVVQSQKEIYKAKAKLSRTSYYRKGKTEDEFVLSTIADILRSDRPEVEFVEIWWTDTVLLSLQRGEEMPTPILDSTVYALDRNSMYRWLKRFGPIHGWEPLCRFHVDSPKLQAALQNNDPVLLSGFGGTSSGYLALLSKDVQSEEIIFFPEQDVQREALVSSFCWVWREQQPD